MVSRRNLSLALQEPPSSRFTTLMMALRGARKRMQKKVSVPEARGLQSQRRRAPP